MTDIETDDFLAHFGVKGMKWGKRGAKATSNSAHAGSIGLHQKWKSLDPATKADITRAAVGIGATAALYGLGKYADHKVSANTNEFLNNVQRGENAGLKVLGDGGANLSIAKTGLFNNIPKITSVK